MHHSNLFTVKQYEVEAPYSPGDNYNHRIGLGVSTSPKLAWELSNKMYNYTSNGGTSLLGSWSMFKGGVKIAEHNYYVWDKGMESSFNQALKSNSHTEK
jgi:hypothetical protein